MMWPFALKEAAYCLNRLSLRLTVEVVKQPSSTLIRTSSIPQHIIPLDHHALYWTLVFNQVLEVPQNGSQDHVLVSVLVTLHLMWDQLP